MTSGGKRRRECLALYIEGGNLDEWRSVRSMYDDFFDRGVYHPKGGRVEFSVQSLGRLLHELKLRGVAECKTIRQGRILWKRVK